MGAEHRVYNPPCEQTSEVSRTSEVYKTSEVFLIELGAQQALGDIAAIHWQDIPINQRCRTPDQDLF